MEGGGYETRETVRLSEMQLGDHRGAKGPSDPEEVYLSRLQERFLGKKRNER